MTEENTVSTETNPQTESLLGEAPAQDTNQTVNTEKVTSETTPGRPEWLPEKFKTGEDFVKSYTELEKKIGEQPRAPEKYDFSYAKDIGLEMTEEQSKETADMFRQYNLTEAQAKGMLSLYSDSMKAFAEQYGNQGPQLDPQVETGKLKQQWGQEYDNNRAALRNFTNTLSKDTLNAPIANTAEGVQLIMDAMKYRQGANPIADTGTQAQVTAVSIREKINELRNSDNYRLPQGDIVGDNTRAEIYRLYQQLDRMPRD